MCIEEGLMGSGLGKKSTSKQSMDNKLRYSRESKNERERIKAMKIDRRYFLGLNVYDNHRREDGITPVLIKVKSDDICIDRLRRFLGTING